jgi:hypothetical protein
MEGADYASPEHHFVIEVKKYRALPGRNRRPFILEVRASSAICCNFQSHGHSFMSVPNLRNYFKLPNS